MKYSVAMIKTTYSKHSQKGETDMIITKTGDYRLTEPWSSRGTSSIAQFKAGAIIKITQVDEKNRHVIGPDLQDWAHWDIPAEPV